MSGSKVRRTSGRLLVSAVILALPLALGGCLKGALPPGSTVGLPPEWSGLTIGLFSQPVVTGGVVTGWETTVNIPQCFDSDGVSVVPTVTVSNGFYSYPFWTRAVSGSPAVAAAGTLTAKCIDHQGLSAHPDLVVTAPALP